VKYTSTRDCTVTEESAVAIKQGLSKEGGLFVPEALPAMGKDWLSKMVDMTYQQRAVEILQLFLTDFTDAELRDCVEGAYTPEKFQTSDIAPIYSLNDRQHILELWHGPTCAFKDMALQILPRFLTYSLKKTGEDKTVVILVATSGDTGKAALEGFRDVDHTKIIVFYPDEGVSNIQKLQMITQQGGNVYVAAVKGNFDDAQNEVKAIFTDQAYAKKLNDNNYILSSANSINWGRLVPQIIYYVSAYCDLVKQKKITMGEKINICVPTGNFGNILAAYYAKAMGLPVGKFICASNANKVLTDFIKTGEYNCNRDFYTTISPSMDILISSNLERLLFELYGRDDGAIVKLMNSLKTEGKYTIDKQAKDALQSQFYGAFATDEETKLTISRIQKEYGYVCDTHTAVGIWAHLDYVKNTNDDTQTIIASTASPFKFSESVVGAIVGANAVSGLDEFALLDKCEEISHLPVPESLKELKTLEPRFVGKCEKNLLSEFVDHCLLG
jgi:threonine synthase